MSGSVVGGAANYLARAVRLGRWRGRSLGLAAPGRSAVPRGLSERTERVRYHLGRGRRAREAGRFEDGAREARLAVAENDQNPWALALLGQCLRHQRNPDLAGARRALERAQALDPTNGYFVRLLLDVLDAQSDLAARADVLAWAWWMGAPVERWLPDGPPYSKAHVTASEAVRERTPDLAEPAAARARAGGPTHSVTRQPILA